MVAPASAETASRNLRRPEISADLKFPLAISIPSSLRIIRNLKFITAILALWIVQRACFQQQFAGQHLKAAQRIVRARLDLRTFFGQRQLLND